MRQVYIPEENKDKSGPADRLFPMLPFVLLAMILTVCNCSSPENDIIGTWSCRHGQGGPNSFEFFRDGTANWIFENEDLSQFALKYSVDFTTDPHRFSLSGFQKPPLQGLVMYGILEFQCPNRFLLDVEAAMPDDDPGQVRPAEFSEDAREYKRVGVTPRHNGSNHKGGDE